jgi:hypothetical protein
LVSASSDAAISRPPICGSDPLFKALEVRAVADLKDAAKARAKEFNVRAESVEDLLAAKDIDVIVNLTIPDAHFAVTKSILEAGKHAYSEKPLVLTLAEGATCGLADGKGCGSVRRRTPSSAERTSWRARRIDEGLIGDVVAGTCHVMSHGMEHWHPNPDFFFLPGAGPVLDVGPYYVTNLIQLIGPVKRVAALATAATDTHDLHPVSAQGREDPGRDADQHPRAARLRQRRDDHAVGKLGCLGSSPRQYGVVRQGRIAFRARSKLLRRNRRSMRAMTAKSPRWPSGIIRSVSPMRASGPRAGELPYGRAGRHGAGHRRGAGRIAARSILPSMPSM